MATTVDAEVHSRGSAEVMVFLTAPAAASAGVSVGAAAAAGTTAAAGAVTPDLAHATRSLMQHFIGDTEELAAGTASFAVAATTSASSRRRGSARAAAVEADDNGAGDGPLFFPNLGIMLGRVNRDGLEGLNADPRVEKVTGTPEFTLIRPVRVAASTSTGQHTWGIRAMRVPTLWAEGLTGENVLVGHLDTGVDGDHAVFDGAIEAFAEFSRLGRQISPDPRPFDTAEHGTHTAATIAARPVGGRSVGVAPGATLASAIVIEGGRVVARILGGMDWAVGNQVRILSMSLGLQGFEDDFLSLTQRLRDQNILPVFAVGNEGVGTSRYPGNYPEALSVGAHDRFGRVASFSSSQRFERTTDPLVPDLVAPGVGVVSARPGGGFQVMDGSSMATPHVAGLAALLMQAHPDATVDEVEGAIFRSCRLPPTLDQERCNRGMPDAVQALKALG
jgi:subtilisin family serine protease